MTIKMLITFATYGPHLQGYKSHSTYSYLEAWGVAQADISDTSNYMMQHKGQCGLSLPRAQQQEYD